MYICYSIIKVDYHKVLPILCSIVIEDNGR